MAHNTGPPRPNDTGPPRPDNDRPAKKRRVDDMLDAVHRQKQKIPTLQMEFESAPDRLTVDPATPLLQLVDHQRVAFELRKGMPHYLESAAGQVNFYLMHPTRDGFANAYRVKVAMDDASIDAFANTVKHLAQRHRGRIANFEFEIETDKVSKTHREYATKHAILANERNAPGYSDFEPADREPAEDREGDQNGGDSANRETPTSWPPQSKAPAKRKKGGKKKKPKKTGGPADSQGTGNPEVDMETEGEDNPNPEDAMETDGEGNSNPKAAEGSRGSGNRNPEGETDQDREVSPERPTQCANCDEMGHGMMDCAFAHYFHGSISGCSVCNTKEHNFDACEQVVGRSTRDWQFIHEMLTSVMWERANKPQIRSATWTFYELLDLGIGHGLVDVNAVYDYPWTNKFAVQVLKCERDDPLLGGKLHPADFDYATHSSDDLPADPQLSGKTVREILAMRGKGFFNQDRFVPQAQKAAFLDDQAIDEIIRLVLKELGGHGELGYGKTREEIAASLKKVKTETTGTVVDQQVTNLGAFREECDMVWDGEDEPLWIMQPELLATEVEGSRSQYKVSEAQRNEIAAKVRKFYQDPTSKVQVRDPVYMRLFAREEQILTIRRGKLEAEGIVLARKLEKAHLDKVAKAAGRRAQDAASQQTEPPEPSSEPEQLPDGTDVMDTGPLN